MIKAALLCLLIGTVLIGWTPSMSDPGTEWPFKEYVYVKAYLYNLQGRLYGHHAIVKKGQLDKTVVNKSGDLLNKEQTETLKDIVSDKHIRDLIIGLSSCYIPHHGFVFYDKADSAVASITVCFYCESIITYPPPYEGFTTSDQDGNHRESVSEDEIGKERVQNLVSNLKRLEKIVTDFGMPVFDGPSGYQRYRPSSRK